MMVKADSDTLKRIVIAPVLGKAKAITAACPRRVFGNARADVLRDLASALQANPRPRTLADIGGNRWICCDFGYF